MTERKDRAARRDTMTDKRLSFFLPFGKVEKTDDGCRMVSGYASTPTLDLDGEIITLACVKSALPDYMEWRNVRQMHQPMAVGVAKEANVDDIGLFLRAKIVDPACVKLIDEDVLKGFSVGGKKIKQDGNTITEMELIEISVVDRPANPDCRIEVMKGAKHVGKRIELVKAAAPTTKAAEPTFDREEVGFLGRLLQKMSGSAPPVTVSPVAALLDEWNKEDRTGGSDLNGPPPLWLNKRDVSDKERDNLADQGKALPDGSFPIASKSDLENAISAFGRAKNPARAKRHIIRRAKALKCTDMLPADWPGSTKDKEKLAAATPGTLAKGATFYTVSSMIELLGRLEWAEECCEGDGGMSIYGGPSETQIEVGKDFTDKFGALLVEFGDLVADLLDRLLSEMADEEREEAAEEAAKVAKRLREPLTKGKPLTFLEPSEGDDTDVVAALAAIVKKNAATGVARTGQRGDVFARLQQKMTSAKG